MRRQERIKRDRRKGLELIQKQLEVQAGKELKGPDLEAFVRLAHFYMAALDVFQPGRVGKEAISEAARRAFVQGQTFEREQQQKALQRKAQQSQQPESPAQEN